MPHSAPDGKLEAVTILKQLPITSAIDVGPGTGTWGELLRTVNPSVRLTAIEVWAPYVSRYDLASKYDRVVIADVRVIDWGRFGYQDLIVLGDVLEHMTLDDAREVLDRATDHATVVLVTVPIGEYPQGTMEGNPFEAHRMTFYEDTLPNWIPGWMAASIRGPETTMYFLSYVTKVQELIKRAASGL